MKLPIALAAASLAVAASALSSHPADASSGKYATTWKKTAGQTTCREYRKVMNPHQRFVMAADLLSIATKHVPADSTANHFALGLSRACSSVPSSSVASVGALLYLSHDY